MTKETPGDLVTLTLRTGQRHDTGPSSTPPPTGTHFVTLVKPEVLTPVSAARTLTAVAERLREEGVTILRGATVPAVSFLHQGCLFQHYPRLHRVAADGPRALTTAAARELRALSDTAEAVGAFEAMARDRSLSPAALEERCRRAGVQKLGSGSYASSIKLREGRAVVLNGFLPSLVRGYAAAPAAVGLMECHSHREIDDLRTHLLGGLHPASAAPGTLRGTVGAVAGQHGVTVSEGRNGVHLSAGHLEGMFQVWRYFTAADGSPLADTGLGRSLADAGADMAAVAALAGDHNLTDAAQESVSPHGATESLARDEVVDRVRRWTITQKGVRA